MLQLCHCACTGNLAMPVGGPSHGLMMHSTNIPFLIALLQWLQTALWVRHKIRTVRRTLAELHDQAEISSSGQLSLQSKSVALVYFRAGYAPTDYPSDKEWQIRCAASVFLCQLDQAACSWCPERSNPQANLLFSYKMPLPCLSANLPALMTHLQELHVLVGVEILWCCIVPVYSAPFAPVHLRGHWRSKHAAYTLQASTQNPSNHAQREGKQVLSMLDPCDAALCPTVACQSAEAKRSLGVVKVASYSLH